MAKKPHETRAPSRLAASTRVHKRKRDTEALTQRQVAQKLQLCADASDSFASIRRSLQRQHQRYKAEKARAEELIRLQSALEQTTQFQTFLGAELDGEDHLERQMMSLHGKMDRLIRTVGNKKRTVEKRTQKIVTKLPRLMTKATTIVSERRQLVKEQEELPTSHQWVPTVLWRVYHDVVEVSRREDEVKPLKRAMHEVMKVLKKQNPFFYLQVLYQPPPEHLNGRWEIHASDKLRSIAQTMDPFFRDLKKRALALKNKKDPYVRIRYGWNQLRVTLAFVRRAARHFHFLILHLYAVAMGCELPNVHAKTILEKAASGILSGDAEMREQLGLSPQIALCEDNLIKETYAWTPELLVYVAEWKRCGKKHFGFTHHERERDFLPFFSPRHKSRKNGRRIPPYDVLADISSHLRKVYHVWRASQLGSSDITVMRIEDIGTLETKIKGHLASVVDLVYKMMLARWMVRRSRSDAWWKSVELCEGVHPEDAKEWIAEVSQTSESSVADNRSSEAVVPTDDLQDITDVDSVEHRDVQRTKMHLPTGDGFRSATTVTLGEIVDRAYMARKAYAAQHSPSIQIIPRELVTDHSIPLRNIYAWNNEEIESFIGESERITEVRVAMVDLYKRLEWQRALRRASIDTEIAPSFGEYIRDDWHVSCIASHLCALTTKAVALAEETALNGAANALTKRPSLRITPTQTVPTKERYNKPAPEDDFMKELEDNVRKAHQNVGSLVDSYDGLRTREWCDFIRSTGQSTTQLLHIVSQSVGSSEIE